MSHEKSPAFQFYFKDWRSSRKVSRMSFKERGMYLEMLIDQWDKGPLPSEPAAIAEQIGAKVSEFLRSWPTLRACFTQSENGWTNARLEAERLKQLSGHQRRREEGIRAASKRWGKREVYDGLAMATHDPPDAISLAISHAIAIAPALATVPAAPIHKAIVEDEIAKRGADLVYRYQALYQEHRQGAHYRPRPNLDWTEACDLCRHWDDARLEKLAILVLTTDEGWISKTDRSFKIFAMKASWADSRLCEWEEKQKHASR